MTSTPNSTNSGSVGGGGSRTRGHRGGGGRWGWVGGLFLSSSSFSYLHLLVVLTLGLVTLSGLAHLYQAGVLFATMPSHCPPSPYDLLLPSPSLRQADLLSRDVGDLRLKLAVALRDPANRRFASLLSNATGSLDRIGALLARAKPSEDAPPTSALSAALPLRRRRHRSVSPGNFSDPDSDLAELSGKKAHEEGGEEAAVEEEEEDTDPLVAEFEKEEIRRYLRFKKNRHRRKNFLGANATLGTIGHACIAFKEDLEQYMSYDVGGFCKDDWRLGESLMARGCDPLPRRRCLARGPPKYSKPLPLPTSLWSDPDERNIRWDKYSCKSFRCLQGSKQTTVEEGRGVNECTECFDLRPGSPESKQWVVSSNNSANDIEFLIADVLAVKPGEIRIGLHLGAGTGTFAARMHERGVTVISATLNAGAPFNEVTALRGLLPLYISPSQRLPFFDNTLDILHSAHFLDGAINLQVLDFILFDWDRVLRPGGLLWIDRFLCHKDDLDDYLYMFLQLRYKKHKWATAPKGKTDVYLSGLLEKPARPF